MGRRIVFAAAVLFFVAAPAAHAQTTTTTTAPATTVERSTANTGPNDYLYFVAAGGMVAIGAGMRMRGARAQGAHWQ
jgi:hypothetical protein